MPSKFNSTAKKPGKAVKKPYNRGGRANLRDEEARVIGVQDDAALEMRRVKARRPHDAAERRDKKSQESRVGSRERNARDEMTRLRGEAVGMGMKTGGKTVKKMATGSQTKADRQDESLGMRDGKESTKTQSYTSRRNESNATRRSTPRAPAPKPSSSRQMSMLIPQHKRMAMGENVLTGKMINKFDGGKLQKTKTPKRPYATTGVNLNMGAPKTRRTTARGMGAATRGGNFTENT